MRTNPESSADDDHGTVGGRARRVQIERAAAEVLSEVGYAATSVSLIAQRAGVSKGVVSYHFASKDEMLRRMALRLLRECAAHIEAGMSAAEPPARLRALLSLEFEFFGSRRVEFLAMAEVMANHRDPSFRDAFHAISDDEVNVLAGILREGEATGEFRGFDADEVAHLILAAKNAVLDRWAADVTLDLRSMSAAMLDFVEKAVRAP